jgi:hypothetical protein
MGAVDKGIVHSMLLPCPVKQAIGTNSHIGRHLRHFSCIGPAGCDMKSSVGRERLRSGIYLNGLNASYRRVLVSYPFDQPPAVFFVYTSANAKPVRMVLHFPAYPHLLRQPVNKGSKANPLHQSPHMYFLHQT